MKKGFLITEKIKPGSSYAKGNHQYEVDLCNAIIEKRGKARVMDIGCKHESLKFPGALGLDILKSDGVDVVHDLQKFPYPFDDGFFDMVIANHIFEHLQDLPAVMEEMGRIIAKGGYLIARSPFFLHHGAFDDPTHVRRLTLRTMDFFCVDSKWKLWGNSASFKIIHKELSFGGEFINPGRFVLRFSERLYEKYMEHLFPGDCLFWVLEAV